MPVLKLKAPTAKDYEQGLPTSKQEAIERGLTRFIGSDGQERVIRNYGSRSHPNGQVQIAATRKANRGGGTEGARKQAEALATPDPLERRAADQEMARMRSRGNVGHHGLPVSALAAGEREKPGTVAAYERVHGKEKVGHRPGALVEMTPEAHDRLHHVQETEYFKAIRKAGSEADAIFRQIQDQLKALKRPLSRFGTTLTDLKNISQQAVDVKTSRMMDPTKRMPIDPKLTGPGGLARQAVKEIAEEAISVGGQALINQLTGAIPAPRSKKRF